MEDTWKIAKNGYGYHDVDAGLDDADPGNGRGGGGSNGQGHGNGNGQGNGNGSGDKPTGSLVTSFSTVVKQFVVDYTSPTFEPLMEHEVNGLDYRYVYGNDRLSVNITGVETGSGNLIENGNQIRLYYHMDYLGTTDYLTSPVSLKVTSWTHYNEWGEITHNAVLKSGKRELDLVKRYATHDYDAVLGMYYAKARFYDAENRRFAAVDPILDVTQYDLREYMETPVEFVQYVYVRNQPIILIDPDGYAPYSARYGSGTYNLFVTPQWLDAGMTVAGLIPGFTPLNALAQRTISGIKKIDFDYWTVAGTLASAIDKATETSVAGWVSFAAEAGTTLLDWLLFKEYTVVEAIQNHFNSRVWISDSREIVEEKFNTAITIISAAIKRGEIEVKKAVDAFGKDAFYKERNLGMVTYQYDSFADKMTIFRKDQYYFFIKCESATGALKEIEDIIRSIGEN